MKAAFLDAIVCSASAGREPPLTRRATIRLCSTRLVGTRKSPGTGISLEEEVVTDVALAPVVGGWVVAAELCRLSHSAVAVIGLV